MEFSLTTRINTKPETIYSAWLNSEEHTNMTGGEAFVSNQVGEQFSAWDGYIKGRNIELETNKRILQSWRTTEFEDTDEDSQIEILLQAIDDQTELTLIHSHLPANGEQYKKGWEEHYFQPMKAYFSSMRK